MKLRFDSRLACLALPLSVAAWISLATPAGAAQVAASIEFEPAARPAGLPDDMQPLPGASLTFLAIKAIDGHKIDAALWRPDNRPAGTTPIMVQVHGSGGNLTELPLRATARALSLRGYAALTINTRQHDEAVNTDNFFDIATDIDAAVATVKALGHTSIVLFGHSLGTIQVQYYAATHWDQAIKAVVLTGAFGRLPWKSRNILIQNDDTYKALGAAARTKVAAGKPDELLGMDMPYIGRSTPVTAQHFLTYRDENSSAADGAYWMPRIPRPILILRDQADGIVLPFEPYMLVSAAHAEGSLVQGITYVMVPDSRPPSAAGHVFTDNTDRLVDTLAAWLAEHL